MIDIERIERTILKRIIVDSSTYGRLSNIFDISVGFFTDVRTDIFNYVRERILQSASTTFDELTLHFASNDNLIIPEIEFIKNESSDISTEVLDKTVLNYGRNRLFYESLLIGSKGLNSDNEHLKAKAELLLDEREKLSIQTHLGTSVTDKSIINYYKQDKKGILTQHKCINDRIGGFLPGTLSLVLATAGVGKSLIMIDLATGFIQQGKNVIVFSLEMSEQEVLTRVHSNLFDLHMFDLRPENFEKIENQFIDAMTDADKMQSNGKLGQLFVLDAPELTVSKLEAVLQKYEQKKITFDVIIIDYMGLMRSIRNTNYDSSYAYVKSISEEVRNIAKKYNVPIISANQLNRQAVNNTNADNLTISDSFGVAMTADLMMFLLQHEDMKASSDMIVKITKNRFTGQTTAFPIKIDYDHMRIVDVENGEVYNQQLINYAENAKKCETLFQDFMPKDKMMELLEF